MLRPETLAITLVIALLALALPRKYFILPFVLTACIVPTDQRLVIGGLDFTVMRILVLVGVSRLFMRGEVRNIKWNTFDKLVVTWCVCGAIIYVIQYLDSRALINRCGVLFDVVGLYWIFRQQLKSWDDIRMTMIFFGSCAFFMAFMVGIEWTSGKNPFAVLGTVVTKVRAGRFRCQASFPHAIMLGVFWASVVPIFIGLARMGAHKTFFWCATGAATFVVAGTASSTPLSTWLFCLVFLPVFAYRQYGKIMVYGLIFMLTILHFIMEAPVWHLIARANSIGGSTGWHRYHLIDNAISHFGDWCLIGVKSTAYWGWGLEDVTNHYILEGVRGGFLTLILFVSVLTIAVKTVGRYSLRPMPRKWQWFIWSICVSILGHCLSFIGVAYFGQIMMLFYLTLAIAGFIYEQSLSQPAPAKSRVQKKRVNRHPNHSQLAHNLGRAK